MKVLRDKVSLPAPAVEASVHGAPADLSELCADLLHIDPRDRPGNGRRAPAAAWWWWRRRRTWARAAPTSAQPQVAHPVWVQRLGGAFQEP